MKWMFSRGHKQEPGVIQGDSREVTATTTRRYTSSARSFELLLSRRVLKGRDLWAIERVMDVSWTSKVVFIPGMQAVTASTPDAAFARASDCIDKWLWKNR